MGARKDEAGTISLMVSSYCNVGEYSRALEMQRAVLPILDEMNERFGTTVAYNNLGIIMKELGDYAQAKWHWTYALTMARTIGSRAHECVLSTGLGELSFLEGKQDAAIDEVKESIQIAREIELPTIEAMALVQLGNILLAMSQYEEAATAFADALRIQHNLGETHRSLEALAGLACVALSQKNMKRAFAHVDEILGYLESRSSEGIPGLFQIYWRCYEVLRAADDGRSSTLLATAHQQLQKRAENIHDAVLRDSFLKLVTPNQAIAREYVQSSR